MRNEVSLNLEYLHVGGGGRNIGTDFINWLILTKNKKSTFLCTISMMTVGDPQFDSRPEQLDWWTDLLARSSVFCQWIAFPLFSLVSGATVSVYCIFGPHDVAKILQFRIHVKGVGGVKNTQYVNNNLIISLSLKVQFSQRYAFTW